MKMVPLKVMKRTLHLQSQLSKLEVKIVQAFLDKINIQGAAKRRLFLCSKGLASFKLWPRFRKVHKEDFMESLGTGRILSLASSSCCIIYIMLNRRSSELSLSAFSYASILAYL